MKRLFGLLLCFVIATTQVAWADTNTTTSDTLNQTNSTGSNTSISGGYSAETTNNYSGGQTNTTTNSTNNNSYTGDTRVTSQSYSPSMSAMSQDLCIVGISGGTYRTDENCERIKLSKVLNDLGMKVAAVSILCQDERVFYAMEQSGTPCPFEGKIGKDAKEQWKKYGKLRPDYELYTDRLQIIEKANKIHEKEIKEKDEVIVQQSKEISQNQVEQKKLELEIEKLKKKNQK